MSRAQAMLSKIKNFSLIHPNITGMFGSWNMLPALCNLTVLHTTTCKSSNPILQSKIIFKRIYQLPSVN